MTIVLGSGIAGLAGAFAAQELAAAGRARKGKQAERRTVNSYGLIWVGQNHLAQATGGISTRSGPVAEIESGYLVYLHGSPDRVGARRLAVILIGDAANYGNRTLHASKNFSFR